MGLAASEGVLCLLLAGELRGRIDHQNHTVAVAIEAEVEVGVAMVVAVAVTGCARDCRCVDTVRGDRGGGGCGHGRGRGLDRRRGRGWP